VGNNRETSVWKYRKEEEVLVENAKVQAEARPKAASFSKRLSRAIDTFATIQLSTQLYNQLQNHER
jgi:hypothetical protein